MKKVMILVAIIFLSSFASAQNSLSDWAQAKTLKSGTRVVVINQRNIEFLGLVQLVSDNEIVLSYEDGSGVQVIKRPEVAEIRRGKSTLSRRVKGGLLGGFIGLGVGIFLGDSFAKASRGAENYEPDLTRQVGGTVGVLFGTTLGAKYGPSIFSGRGGPIYLAK